MPDLIKVGITEDLERRMKELDKTGIPLPFECFYAVEIDETFAMAFLNLQGLYVMNNQGNKRLETISKAMEYIYKIPERFKYLVKLVYFESNSEPEKMLQVVKMHLDLFPHDISALEIMFRLLFSIGDYAMAGMCSAVNMDIPAFVRAQGNMATVQGLNLEGMKRRGMTKENIQNLQKAYKLVYRDNKKLDEAMQEVKSMYDSLTDEAEKTDLQRFISSVEASRRGLLR